MPSRRCRPWRLSRPRLRLRPGLGLPVVEVFAQLVGQGRALRRVAAARVRRRALAQRRKLALARVAKLLEALVLEKPGVVQRRHQPARGLRHRDLPGHARERRAQLAFVLLAVEAAEAARQQRRDQQRHLREPKRIADDQPRLLAQRRRHDVEIGPQSRQGGCHRVVSSSRRHGHGRRLRALRIGCARAYRSSVPRIVGIAVHRRRRASTSSPVLSLSVGVSDRDRR